MTDTETKTIKSGYQLSCDLLRQIDNQYKKDDTMKPGTNHFYRDELHTRLNFIRALNVVVGRTVNKKLVFHEQNR